ncbi:15870_t:CDS:1, partial [Entrophospora sp. SA101]
ENINKYWEPYIWGIAYLNTFKNFKNKSKQQEFWFEAFCYHCDEETVKCGKSADIWESFVTCGRERKTKDYFTTCGQCLKKKIPIMEWKLQDENL